MQVIDRLELRLGRMGLWAAILAVLTFALALTADPLVAAGTSRSDTFRKQASVLDKRGVSQFAYSSRLLPPTTSWDGVLNVPPSGGNAKYRKVYMPMAYRAARKHGIPEALFARLVQQESGWNPHARSHKGAIGLAQLMPGTAEMLGVNPSDPWQNLEGGARYLRTQYNTFGSWRLAPHARRLLRGSGDAPLTRSRRWRFTRLRLRA
ncbi:MAG: lytic transglycosylase domain-containing protein, partial [Mangrovicoccus sp.]